MLAVIEIVTAGPEHEQGWRALWALYCGGGVGEATTAATWRRILDPASSIGASVATEAGAVVGFVTYVEHEGTWETTSLCYVEDLYVAKSHRGDINGVGQALAGALLTRLRAGEWSRLYCITEADNFVAQRLYSGFAKGVPYLRYVLRGANLDPQAPSRMSLPVA